MSKTCTIKIQEKQRVLHNFSINHKAASRIPLPRPINIKQHPACKRNTPCWSSHVIWLFSTVRLSHVTNIEHEIT